MTAEAIAAVVRDIKMGRVYDSLGGVVPSMNFLDSTRPLAETAVVVDSTVLYHQHMGTNGTKIYEDHRVCPPWLNAFIGYVNEWGNVYVAHLTVTDREMMDEWTTWKTSAPTHEIDWDRVAWMYSCVVFLGGMGNGFKNGAEKGPQHIPTTGPMIIWRIPVYPDGEMADLQWTEVAPNIPRQTYDNMMMTMLSTLNMCNCVNVEIAVPTRPRTVRRRLDRTGVTVSEIHVRPVSRSYRGIGKPLSEIGDTPLSAVRGHFAQYGPKYGRGLLFGKLEGRYWIPQHVRGSADAGEVQQQQYTMEA